MVARGGIEPPIRGFSGFSLFWASPFPAADHRGTPQNNELAVWARKWPAGLELSRHLVVGGEIEPPIRGFSVTLTLLGKFIESMQCGTCRCAEVSVTD